MLIYLFIKFKLVPVISEYIFEQILFLVVIQNKELEMMKFYQDKNKSNF